jgi:hypothetical protein
MGYPESAEGFMVNDQKNWTKFEKKEVRGCSRLCSLPADSAY